MVVDEEREVTPASSSVPSAPRVHAKVPAPAPPVHAMVPVPAPRIHATMPALAPPVHATASVPPPPVHTTPLPPPPVHATAPVPPPPTTPQRFETSVSPESADGPRQAPPVSLPQTTVVSPFRGPAPIWRTALPAKPAKPAATRPIVQRESDQAAVPAPATIVVPTPALGPMQEGTSAPITDRAPSKSQPAPAAPVPLDTRPVAAAAVPTTRSPTKPVEAPAPIIEVHIRSIEVHGAPPPSAPATRHAGPSLDEFLARRPAR